MYVEDKAERMQESEVTEGSKETVSFRHNTVDNTIKLQEKNKFKPDKVPWSREN